MTTVSKCFLWMLLFGVFSFSGAQAQIRCVGTLRLQFRADQVPIERAFEDAYRQGRLESNAAEWERMMNAMSEGRQLWRNAASFDTLKRRNYLYSQTHTKTFLIYISQIKTFLFVSTVNCLLASTENQGGACDLCIESIRELDFLQESVPLSRKQRRYYEDYLYDYLICSQRLHL